MKRQTLYIGTVLIFLLSLAPQAMAGTGMVELLNLTGARQAAMGETTSLLDVDPYDLEYNPATLAGIIKGRVGFSHNNSFLDWNTSSVAAMFPVKSVSCGLHIRYSGFNEIESRQAATTQPDYLFDAQDVAAKAFFGLKVTPKLKAAISLGWLMEKIDIYRGSAFAFGLGVIYRVHENAAVHGSISNLGSKFSYQNEKNDLPTIYRLGASASKYGATVNADYVNIKSGDGHLHLGAEYLIQKYLFLRAGYQTGYDSKDISAGAGFVYNNFRVDYAFVPYDSDLGDSHRFTLTVSL